MKYNNTKDLLKAGNFSTFAGGEICGWAVSFKNGDRIYFDSKEEADFYTNGASHCEVLPIYCDEIKE